MEINFSFLRTKEIINIYDGKRLGRIIDVSFDKESGKVLGFIVPGIKKVFKKSGDIFIPLELIKKIGDDVILVKLCPIDEPLPQQKQSAEEIKTQKTYARYRRVAKKE
ncbi:MAG: YlmC/YmxH family sporulation protein [Clostridia bacterium]|nr:YlmC/YmxH family sporulation protein [Clostridia bacterium]